MTEEIKTEQNVIAEYRPIDAAISALQEKYANRVYDVTTYAGMKDAKVARAEVRGSRTELERIRKDIKAPALQRCRDIDAEAKRITEALLAIEQPIDELIKAEEKRKADEKAAAEVAERDRVASIQQRITEIQQYPVHAIGMSAGQISELIAELDAVDMSGMQEFDDFGISARRTARGMLVKAQAGQEAVEAEDAKRAADAAAERERLAQERREQAARDAAAQEKMEAERERLAQEAAALREREEAIARQQKAEQDRIQKEKDEAAAVAERAEQEREAERLADERRERILKSRCTTQNEALKDILAICCDDSMYHLTRLMAISEIAEANINAGD